MKSEPEITEVSFPHGLGDCVYFAHALALYKKKGRMVRVKADPEKQLLFNAAGVARCEQTALKVAWIHGENIDGLTHGDHWKANKAFRNFSLPPMPDIGAPSPDLWDEYCRMELDIVPQLPRSAFEEVDTFFSRLVRPIVLLHSKGNSFQSSKSVPDELAVAMCREILEQTGGTVLLLDWDNRVPKIAHGRMRHLTEDWKRIGVPELIAAIARANILVGVDSGPLHLCRLTKTPSVGLWYNRHHPALYSLPRREQINITIKKHMHRANRLTRWIYNIIEEQGETIAPQLVGRTCVQMLEQPRYLDPGQRGRDVMLRHWVSDWTRGGVSALGTFVDRDVSLDLLLLYSRKFSRVEIVETGCIRAAEDWRGAGYATYLLSAYAAASGGSFVSVDHSERNCEFARGEIGVFGSAATVICSDSVSYLNSRARKIDILYLDSWDTTVPGYAEHGLAEIVAAESLLHEDSLVVYDDTSISGGTWIGKGRLGVPWLLERRWRPVHIGHQTVLVRQQD